ncbi:hypothetical protein M3Y99_01838500 [Aphelenchoides fujianensis]|nr:hypothetical protein M3Y99_01838500 [Aphelenchoides fujianensis]
MLLLRRRRKLCCVLLLSITGWLFFYAFRRSDGKGKKRVVIPMPHLLLIDEDCLRNLSLSSSSCLAPLEVAVLDEQRNGARKAHRMNRSASERTKTNKPDSVNAYSLFNLTHRLQTVEFTDQVNDEQSPAEYLLFVALNQTDDQGRAWNRAIPLTDQLAPRIIELNERVAVEVLVPAHIPRFLRHWANGRLVVPPRLDGDQAAEWNETDRTVARERSRVAAEVTRFFDQHNETLLLNGDALKAWHNQHPFRRPHSPLRFLVRNHSFPLDLVDFFANSSFTLVQQTGDRRDSFGFSFFPSARPEWSVEVFFVYELNATADYHVVFDPPQQSADRWIWPRIERTCAADHFGRLLWIPCNYEQAEFGDEWAEKVDFSDLPPSPNRELFDRYTREELARVFVRFFFPETTSTTEAVTVERILLDEEREYEAENAIS